MTLLTVSDLSVRFGWGDAVVEPVSNISFDIEAGETLGMVGETGSGKSLTATAILGLTALKGGKATGLIEFDGRNLLEMTDRELQNIRGSRISFIPQNPMTSLDPVLRVGDQVVDGICRHLGLGRAEARARALDLMSELQISNPERVFRQYPHQLSGGLKQRIVIAISISTEPDLIIADEPTTALDVTVQAQILRLLRKMVAERGVGLLMITHDLGVISETCHKVAVMYAGNLVEYGDLDTVFGTPRHPYTGSLLECIPRIGMEKNSLRAIPGNVPTAGNFPHGCRFRPRCKLATPQCAAEDPPLVSLENSAKVKCINFPSHKG